jgi:DMSO/TMAO reductase YedYZ heme-binding membrane subunit
MNDQIWWLVARSSGIVSWGLLSAAVILGLLLSSRVGGKRPPPAWLLDLHRMLGGLAVAFVAVHLAGLWLDDFVQFGIVDLLVPFASDWRPVAVAFGVVALYLLVAVQVSSLMMKRLPTRLWRWIHYSSYLLFWMAAVHGAAAGTDAGHPAYVAGSVFSIGAVLFLTVYRLLTPRRGRSKSPRKPPAPRDEPAPVEAPT